MLTAPMKTAFKTLVFSCLLSAGSAALAKEETLTVFDQRHVVIAVPEGFAFSFSQDAKGITTVLLANPAHQIELQLAFLPDAPALLVDEEQRKGFIAKAFLPYAEGSVEKSFDFQALAPRASAGTYVVFTDASLVGKLPPPGQFLRVTCGIKAWPGAFVVFTLLSNETTSRDYHAALTLLRESVQEKPASPKI